MPQYISRPYTVSNGSPIYIIDEDEYDRLLTTTDGYYILGNLKFQVYPMGINIFPIEGIMYAGMKMICSLRGDKDVVTREELRRYPFGLCRIVERILYFDGELPVEIPQNPVDIWAVGEVLFGEDFNERTQIIAIERKRCEELMKKYDFGENVSYLEFQDYVSNVFLGIEDITPIAKEIVLGKAEEIVVGKNYVVDV